MNISQLMKSLLGETTGGEPRALELKIGQVVRGVVIRMLDNREAVVQINGLQVRARLESSLQPGQSALLQVQPESNEGLIVLKQAATNTGVMPGQSAADWLKLLELPDQKWALAFANSLRAAGTVQTPETAVYFRQAAAGMPPDADPERWMQAAGTAFGRGLPPTAATIDALKHALFDRPVHELLETLERQLAQEGKAAVAVSDAALRLQALLREGEALLRSGVEGGSGGGRHANLSSGANSASGAEAVLSLGIESGGAPEATNGSASSETSGRGGSAAPTAAGGAFGNGPTGPPLPSAVPGGASGSGWIGRLMKWLGVDHEHAFAKSIPLGAASSAHGAPAPEGSPGAALQATGAADLRLADPVQTPNSRAAGGQAAIGLPPSAAQTLSRSGTELLLPGSATDAPPPAAAEPLLRSGTEWVPPGGTPDAPPPAVREQARETLKSALLALVSDGDTPDALRETAQQLVGNITGQQLLMAPERSGVVFSHMTLFVPLLGPDGGRTASVQIQARRNRRGELDADNCRLLFDLTMHTLGSAMVDVNVMDKIVSVTLWNDHPAIGRLTESFRAEMAEKLSAAGYKLLSLRSAEFPDRTEAPAAAAADMQGYAPYRYKGVDVRA